MEQENQVGILPLILAIKEKCKNKNIWIYTGYRLEDFNINGRKYVENVTEQILNNIDVLVDGPFIEEQKNISLSFRGSENQRILYKNVDF
jgi:anaerobic ribonucleoside-triphosphate reductase activating protein